MTIWTPRPVILEETEHPTQKINRLSSYPNNLINAKTEITNLLFIEEDRRSSDVIFVFGAKPRPEFVTKITDLAQSHISSTIILTGGLCYENELGVMIPEVHFIRSHLDNLSHCFKTICIEDASRHTVENIIEAQKKFDFNNVSSISVVGMHYALLRQLQTLKCYLPDNKIYYPLPYTQSVNGHLVSADTWHNAHSGRQLVWGEIMRLYQYDERGYIRLDPDVKERVIHIFDLLNYQT